MELYHHFQNQHNISQAFRGYSDFAPAPSTNVTVNDEKGIFATVSRSDPTTLAVTASIDVGKSVGAIYNRAESKTTTSKIEGEINKPSSVQTVRTSTEKIPMSGLQLECKNVRTAATTYTGDLDFSDPTVSKMNPATTPQSPISHSKDCTNSSGSNLPNVERMEIDPKQIYNNHRTSTNWNQEGMSRLIFFRST